MLGLNNKECANKINSTKTIPSPSDNFYRSTFAIPDVNKARLDELVVTLGLDSMADLLNMLVADTDKSTEQLQAMSAAYAITKRECLARGRVDREIVRFQAKLAAVTSLKV